MEKPNKAFERELKVSKHNHPTPVALTFPPHKNTTRKANVKHNKAGLPHLISIKNAVLILNCRTNRP